MITVQVRQPYPVLIQAGIWQAPAEHFTMPRLRIVTDANVERWVVPLHDRLKTAGFDVDVLSIPAGEASKTLDTCRLVYSFLTRTQADRHTGLVAAGGGVVGDLAGFAAATYMRGMPLVHMPTSLLAQVDSSIGSKVAVDLPEGKNLVGAFYDPVGILTDPHVLSTLPPREIATGMAEVIKAALIASPSLFERCRQGPPADLVEAAVRIKAAIVTRDPFETGERMQLNLGHTLGHALEAATGYARLTHGEAVSIGTVAAIRLSRRLGVLQDDMEADVAHVLSHWGLPVRAPGDVPWEALRPAFLLDKKRVGAKTRYVVPEVVGRVRVLDDVNLDEVGRVYRSLQEGA
ncbi:MAG TPA: 3-dehydroquinate synthase [Candidatus Xenobia bacterium]|jgi:3-dehydroquinate synthase